MIMYVKEQMMEKCGMENLSAHKNLDSKSVMNQVKNMDLVVHCCSCGVL
jgi:hypothetical protein